MEAEKRQEVTYHLRKISEIARENNDNNGMFFAIFSVDDEKDKSRSNRRIAFVGTNRDLIQAMHSAVSGSEEYEKNLRRVIIKSLMPTWLIRLETRIFGRW